MGLPGLLIDIVGSGPVTSLDMARQMSLMIDGVAGVAWTHGCSRRGRGPVTTLDTAR